MSSFSSPTTAAARRVIVIQDGARLHYAIPLAFQHAGMLERMYTTWYSQSWSFDRALAHVVKWLNRPLGQKMLDRYALGLDYRKVVSLRGLVWQERAARKRLPPQQFYEWVSEQFASRVRQRGWGRADTLFGFIRNIHPDLCRVAKESGLQTLGDQMCSPGKVQLAEAQLQQERFGEWSNIPVQKPEDFSIPYEQATQFEQATWKHLDHITCASTYVRDGLLQQGIEAERLSVLPYPIDASKFQVRDRRGRAGGGGPIVVGFVGAVGLLKGAPYFVEVARRLAGRNIRFVMVGGLDLSESILPEMRKHVELIGLVPRSDVRQWLEKFDIYFFPSTCEGSAGSVMEAMATGLPIVTSPNSGSIVEHGVSGYVHAYSDVEAFAEAIERLAGNADERHAMGQAGRAAAEKCSIASYSEQWKGLLSRLKFSAPPPSGENVRP
ncbi:MAG: glycosyltransferase family 4 protein [Phycisphaerales bacterium]|nr:glycosyltransferase family 4 protein [Phycisphaerales bacterium]